MTQVHTRVLAGLAAIFILGGCTTTPETAEGQGEEAAVVDQSTTAGSGSDSSATTTGVDEGTGYRGDPLEDPASLLYSKIVYFDFDKSDIRIEDSEIIEAHARYLADHPAAKVTLEGHADERGTREYNIALAERRANAVRNLMTLSGGAGQQIRTVSYGEERPADQGHTEAAWALNRRVEIIYISR